MCYITFTSIREVNSGMEIVNWTKVLEKHWNWSIICAPSNFTNKLINNSFEDVIIF